MGNELLEREILFNFLVQDIIAKEQMTKQEAIAFVKEQLKKVVEHEN